MKWLKRIINRSDPFVVKGATQPRIIVYVIEPVFRDIWDNTELPKPNETQGVWRGL